jgi:hypothetical protein
MSISDTHSTGTRRRRRWLIAGLAVLSSTAAVITLGVMPAMAVHDTGAFELDGNATNGAAAGDDWDNVCHQVLGTDCSTGSNTSGATAVSFTNDGAQNATIFTGGGSKDPTDISGWAWKDQSGGLPDKDNLQDSFAARYPSTSEGDVLYFGSDRFDNSGDAQQGFWFFQNKVTTNSNGTFSGVHKVGDLLILSDFSNGGTTSTINIYKWVGTGGDTNGTLQFLAGGKTAGCGTAAANDKFCGIVNPNSGTTAPWAFTDKSGNSTYLQGEFYEGGVNLTSLGLSGECFATVSSETRSSTSPTAVLKDFVLGGFGNCGSQTVTTPQLGDGSPIPDAGVSIGANASVAVQDKAVVSLPGSINPTGTVSFHLCGPTPLSDANYTLCTTGGTAIGSDKTLSGNSNPATVTSDNATVTSAGRYCWRADYSGDASRNITGSSDSSVTECFKVLPLQPTLSTQAGPGPVSLGSPITDTATLTGTANKPGSPVINPTTPGGSADGSITFTLYGPNDCTTVAFTSTPVAVSGDGTYGPVSFTPTSPGTYHWAASYTGDAPNTLSATHNNNCTDTGEDVVVQQLTTHISTGQNFVPNDSATITVDSGGGDLAGNVVFKLFVNDTTCSGTADYTSDPIDITTGTGTGLNQTVSSSNTKAYSTDGTTFSWLVTYTSTKAGHTDVTSSCNTENSSITIHNG